MNFSKESNYRLTFTHTLVIALASFLILGVFKYILNDNTIFDESDATVFHYDAENYLNSLNIDYINKYNNLYKLESKSDKVLRVTFNSYNQTDISNNYAIVNVKQVYKGDDIQVGDKIRIKDEISFVRNGSSIRLKSKTFLLPMRENQEYIVFIKKYGDNYKYTAKGLSRYNTKKDKILYVMNNEDIKLNQYDIAYYDENSYFIQSLLSQLSLKDYGRYMSYVLARENVELNVRERYGD